MRYLTVLVCIFMVCGCAHHDKGPALQAEVLAWDFGRVDADSSVLKVIDITNTGSRELSISGIDTDCDCLTAEISRKKIPPKGIAVLEVTYNSENKPSGEDMVSLSIISNAASRPVELIMFYATIPTSGKTFDDKPDVPGIKSADLYRLAGTDKKPVILDVRNASSFQVRHIPGAVSFPRKRFEKNDKELGETLSSIDRDDLVVVYCGTGYNSSFVVRELINRGYKSVNLDGISHWTNKGFPVESDI